MESICDRHLGIPVALSKQLSRQQSIYSELSRNLLKIQESTPLTAKQNTKYEIEITESQDILKWLSRTWVIMRRLQEASMDKIASALKNSSEAREVALANDILRHTAGTQGLESISRENVKISPYINLFLATFFRLGTVRHAIKNGNLEAINIMLNQMEAAKSTMSSLQFKRERDHFERSARANEKSLNDYLRHLASKYDQLTFSRIYLYINDGKPYGRHLEFADYDHLKKMRQIIKKWLDEEYGKHLDEYIIKLETGPLWPPHFHLTLIFSKENTRFALSAGRTIGEHWINDEDNTGRSFYGSNPHTHKLQYKNGCIGTFDTSGSELSRQYQDLVIHLTQIEHLIKPVLPNGVRTLFRRTIPTQPV